MNLLSGLFRSRDKPMTDSTAGGAYRFFFGGSTSGKIVTERSSMQMTAVYSCVRILAEAVAGLPLQFYRYMRMEEFRSIILMYIALVMLKKWMRLDMRTIFMEKVSALSSGPI